MHSLFPTKGTLQYTFASQSSFACRNSHSPSDSKPAESSQKRLFSTWSAVDDVKSKASSLSDEAQKEISKASAAAQAKTGQIEIYSAEYYAACTFGGLAACVSATMEYATRQSLMIAIGLDAYCGDPLRSGEMSPPGRLQVVQG